MNTNLKRWARALCPIAGIFAFLFLFPGAARAQSQFLTVDCTGATPWAFTSIQAAVYSATPDTFILVTGPCNEYVSIYNRTNLTLGAHYGSTVTIAGNISISNSTNVYLYGLNVTNPYGDGIDVWASKSVTLDTCTSSNNRGSGVSVAGISDVMINTTGTFDRNGGDGLSVFGSSWVYINAWFGPVDISNNSGPGIGASQANVLTLGRTTINNNGFGTGEYGLDLRGGARVQFGAISVWGPNSISGNQAGGVSLVEAAEIAIWSGGFAPSAPGTVIQANGPVGISAGLGSEVAVYGPVQITGHSSAGVDVYSNSQASFFGPNLLQGNGSAGDQRSAAIRLDGNSQALLRGGAVSNNNGPGLLALVNSSADFSNVNFSGNAGVITCDSTSAMVSDLAQPASTPATGVACKTPHALGNRQISNTPPQMPDISAPKAAHDRYAQLAVKH